VTERPPHSISNRAADDLTYIRSTMERSSAFTAVPGVGGALTGVIGLVATVVGAMQPTPDRWLEVWLAAAVTGGIVGLAAMTLKARRAGMALTGRNARRFAVGMTAAMVAGAAITYRLWTAREYTAMPPVWLLMYGVGAIAGGMFSVPVVRAFGVGFMAAGIAAVITPPDWGNVWLAIGFGGLHVAFGAYIARYHGG
jgi:hypothetical protein